MIALVNTNRMAPLIAPIGLDYIAGALRRAGAEAEVVDLALADDAEAELERRLAAADPQLVAVTFRNTDDCFYPSAQSFLPALQRTVASIRRLTGAPVVLGGVGFSIMPGAIVERVGAEFGIRGDGEASLPRLHRELLRRRRFEDVPGLIWRDGGVLRRNAPAWPETLRVPTERAAIDNAAYFRLGGQGGFETKRGCDRGCAYCADALAKGPSPRLRPPAEVADEVASLLRQGVDVLHTCDCEFNVPVEHAREVCRELIRRRLGERVRWYAYVTVRPFDAALAALMRRAGCVGVNFTTDSACPAMLAAYRQPHRKEDIARVVAQCKAEGIAVMLDLLLGGPGETAESLAETIGFLKRVDADAVGAALGVRVYPGTPMERMVARAERRSSGGIRRDYDGPVDLLRPTFYVSPALGDAPAALVRELIAGDVRFFEPADDTVTGGDHNYNDNTALVEAIAGGARGAYWHILRRMRGG
jgi:radical SAM superfamily enzyme YgiQ (UPF0313 family)